MGVMSRFIFSGNNSINSISGMIFRKIRVGQYLGKTDGKKKQYRVHCNCGKTFVAEHNDLKARKIRSCGCNDFTIMSESSSALNSILSSYKASAKKRNLTFHLEEEYFFQLIKQNCYYCDAGPSNLSKRKIKDTIHTFKYNGIDRLDNRFGYEIDNVISCCRLCNLAKGTSDSISFIRRAITISKKHQSTIEFADAEGI